MKEGRERYVTEARDGSTVRLVMTLADQEDRTMYTSDRRLWLTEDRETVVEDGDPRARFLLVGAEGEIPDADAKRYGLMDPPKSEAPADVESPEAKAQKPAANKAQAKSENK